MIGQITILNSKERKLLLQSLNQLYQIDELPDYTYFFVNKKEKLYVCNKEIFDFNLEELKTNNVGLYIGTYMVDGFRFSIEGSQIFGKIAKKNILEISEEDRNKWIKGEDISTTKFDNEYVILKHKNDFFASAKVKNNIIKNYIPKARSQKKVFGED